MKEAMIQTGNSREITVSLGEARSRPIRVSNTLLLLRTGSAENPRAGVKEAAGEASGVEGVRLAGAAAVAGDERTSVNRRA
jgi:hypothetical protein